MTVDDLLANRHASQGIAPPRDATPAAVVARLGAVQAQDYLASLWAIGLRFESATIETVEFVLVDDWVPPSPMLAREDAIARLASRYVSGHGPATLRDFAWWSGLPVADARAGIASLPREWKCAVGSEEHWMPSDLTASGTVPRASLLPAFDEYVVGYTKRAALFDPRHTEQATSSSSTGLLSPAILVDGKIAGTWRRTRTRGAVTITLRPIAPLGRAERAAVEVAAARYGEFLLARGDRVGTRRATSLTRSARFARESDPGRSVASDRLGTCHVSRRLTRNRYTFVDRGPTLRRAGGWFGPAREWPTRCTAGDARVRSR